MDIQLPTNRKFGFLFALVFFCLAVREGAHQARGIASIFFIVASFFGTAGFLNAAILTPLNKAWFLLGQAMGKILSPIVLGIIFFLILTPVAYLARLMGRDVLRLKRGKHQTYWREPVGSNSDSNSFRDQF